MSEIFVIDPIGITGEKCKCGQDAMFLLGINGTQIHLCADCIAEVAKRIIDGLR